MRSASRSADCLGYDFKFKENAELTGKFAKKIFSMGISNLQSIAGVRLLTGEKRHLSLRNVATAWFNSDLEKVHGGDVFENGHAETYANKPDIAAQAKPTLYG